MKYSTIAYVDEYYIKIIKDNKGLWEDLFGEGKISFILKRLYRKDVVGGERPKVRITVDTDPKP